MKHLITLLVLFQFSVFGQDMIFGGAKDQSKLYTTAQRDGWLPGSLIWQMTSKNQYTSFDTMRLNEEFGLSQSAKGFNGGVFDGRYIYFIPNHDGRDYHGKILRFDSSAPFNKMSSWKVFDIASVNPNLTGFTGASIIDGYLYLSPYFTGGQFSGRIPRYELGKPFNNKKSWDYVDVAEFYPKAKGFYGTITQGSYIYFVPLRDSNQFHGRVLRYNTKFAFDKKESWTLIDLKKFFPKASGFLGAVKTKNHLYFIPFKRDKNNYSGTLVRYSFESDFKSKNSWESLDLTTFDDRFTGYRSGLVYKGFLFLNPYKNDSEHGQALKLDLSKDWKQRSSWELFDIEQIEKFAHGFSSVIDFQNNLYFLRSHNDNGLRKAYIYRPDEKFTQRTAWEIFDFKRK